MPGPRLLGRTAHVQAAILVRTLRGEVTSQPDTTLSTGGFGVNISGVLVLLDRRPGEIERRALRLAQRVGGLDLEIAHAHEPIGERGGEGRFPGAFVPEVRG